VVGIIYLDFVRLFDTSSYSILVGKLIRYGLERRATKWVENI